MPVGIAYGVWTAAGSHWSRSSPALLFGDPLTPVMLGGIGLIIAGVLTIELTGAVD